MKLKIIFILLVTLLIAGCGIAEDDLTERVSYMEFKFSGECALKNMKFVTVSMQSWDSAEVHCYTESPLMHYKFLMEME